MTTPTTSMLHDNIKTVLLLWMSVLVIGELIKFLMLQTIKPQNKTDNNVQKYSKNKKSQICKYIKLFNIAISIIAIVALLFFALFANNAENKPIDTKNITPAPLPKNFEPLNIPQIKKSNEIVTTKRIDKINEKARKENSKAMNESINLFKNTK